MNDLRVDENYNQLKDKIDIEKSTNGEDADNPKGPDILVGDAVKWLYLVTNNGNVTLTEVVVTDPLVTVSGGPLAELAVGVSRLQHQCWR